MISACGRYRSDLSRWWGPGRMRRSHCALFIMLNPSIADAKRDDPTIRRCIGFARAAGCDGLSVANLFQLRATKPDALLIADAPLNPAHPVDGLYDAIAGARVVVAAWGALHAKLAWRAAEVQTIADRAGRTLHHLGLTKSGQPRHPLYVSKSVQLVALDTDSRSYFQPLKRIEPPGMIAREAQLCGAHMSNGKSD